MAQSSREISWSAIVADFHRSGMTHVEFCRTRRIPIHFCKWLYRLRLTTPSAVSSRAEISALPPPLLHLTNISPNWFAGAAATAPMTCPLPRAGRPTTLPDQCSVSLAGHGSLPGGIVSLLVIWPLSPWAINSAPPAFDAVLSGRPDGRLLGLVNAGTEQEFGDSFEHEDGDTQGERASCWEIIAYTRAARHAAFLRGGDQLYGLWREGVYPVSSQVQARHVKTTVVGWAKAELPAAGFGTDHDRMTSLLSHGVPFSLRKTDSKCLLSPTETASNCPPRG
jgi:hypothetical protein